MLTEPTIEERVAAAEAALHAYEAAKPTDPDSLLVDLLTDLMHWAHTRGSAFDNALHVARGHYAAEQHN